MDDGWCSMAASLVDHRSPCQRDRHYPGAACNDKSAIFYAEGTSQTPRSAVLRRYRPRSAGRIPKRSMQTPKGSPACASRAISWSPHGNDQAAPPASSACFLSPIGKSGQRREVVRAKQDPGGAEAGLRQRRAVVAELVLLLKRLQRALGKVRGGVLAGALFAERPAPLAASSTSRLPSRWPAVSRVLGARRSPRPACGWL